MLRSSTEPASSRASLAAMLSAMLWALAMLWTPAQVSAQRGDAEALIAEGVQLRRAHDEEGALERFRRAYELTPSGRALAQIGLAEQALGLWVQAQGHLEEALTSTEAWVERNRRTIEQALEEVRTHVATLDVRTETPGAELFIDGAAMGPLPLSAPLRLVGGASVSVEVRAPGYRTAERVVVLTGGSTSRESFALVEQPPEPAAVVEVALTEATATAANEGETLRAVGVTTLVAGTAILGIGALGIGLSFERADVYNADGCVDLPGMTRSERCGGVRSESEAWSAVGVVGLAAGTAFAVSGIVLLVLAPSDSTEDLACIPVVGPSQVGGHCAIGF